MEISETTYSISNEKSKLKKYSKILLLALCVYLFNANTTMAQEAQMNKPTWWFGVSGAGNINFYNGSTQELNSSLKVPAALHEGLGLGLFLSPIVEYHLPESKWGFMMQVGYDSRKGRFNKVNSPCNCPEDLKTKLSYISIEPSLRYAPFNSSLYLFGGTVLAFNLNKSFEYQLEANPDIPNQTLSPAVNGDFSNINKTILSAHIGAGYDINLSAAQNGNQYVISPFITYLPYLGQTPRSIETWSVNTLRIGAILKVGRSKNNDKQGGYTNTNALVRNIEFSVYSPKNVPTERRVRETFPIRNYIFFDDKQTAISDRYVLIKKSETADFKEDQLEVLTPKRLSGRSDREMIVYYNILNILGDRMQKNPNSKIKLVGSSENGPVEGKEMAESVKFYLTDVWSINADRIATEGNDKPKIPSELDGGTNDLVLLSEGNRRVSIESNSPELLMEFQSGPDASLKPVKLITTQSNTPDSYVTFTVPNALEQLDWWSLEITDDNNNIQKYGPFIDNSIMITGKKILGTKKEGTFKVKMTAKTKEGNIVTRESKVDMVLWTPPQDEMSARYSVLYEYNTSKTIGIYEKYLTEIVANEIPKNATVFIQGFTDVIGNEANNKKISLARAEDVLRILKTNLDSRGRSDVKYRVIGYGEDASTAPFNNQYPEERFYNRTVIIDIIPAENSSKK